MTSVTFDTLKFAETLIASGVPEPQAKAMATAFREAQSDADIATKLDIELLHRDLKALEEKLRAEMWKAIGAQTVVLIGAMVALKVLA